MQRLVNSATRNVNQIDYDVCSSSSSSNAALLSALSNLQYVQRKVRAATSSVLLHRPHEFSHVAADPL